MATKDISDLEVLLAYRQHRRDLNLWPYELLMASTGQCFKVCWRAMERAERRGLIEYGVNLRSGWITAVGKEILRAAGVDPEPKPKPKPKPRPVGVFQRYFPNYSPETMSATTFIGKIW